MARGHSQREGARVNLRASARSSCPLPSRRARSASLPHRRSLADRQLFSQPLRSRVLDARRARRGRDRNRAAGKLQPRGWKARTPHHGARRPSAVTRREERAAKRHSARSVALRGRIASLWGSPIISKLSGARSSLFSLVAARRGGHPWALRRLRFAPASFT
jgi:hypothetical protein